MTNAIYRYIGYESRIRGEGKHAKASSEYYERTDAASQLSHVVSISATSAAHAVQGSANCQTGRLVGRKSRGNSRP